MGTWRSPLRVGILTFVLGIWIEIVQGSGDPCGSCPIWEACNIHLDPDEVCVPINYCGSHPPGDSDPGTDRLTKRAVSTGNQTDQGCDSGEICCGGGPENCVCPSPKIKDKKGQCRECDCPWNERCTAPHGDCVCDEHQVRKEHDGPCVDCDPELSCPKCGPGRICNIHQGNLGNVNSSTCECLPGSVEKDGECVWCHGCPKDCRPDQVCVTPGFAGPYCGCPPGKEEIDGKCVHCPKCPDCLDGKVCVVEGTETRCECPSGTIPQGDGCLAMPHPVFHKRGGIRHDRYRGRYESRYENGHYGSGYYGNSLYGSGHYGDYQKFNHGTGPVEDYFEGSGHYQGGPHGSGSHGSGSYGSGFYGSGSHGNGRQGSGRYGSGPYGSGPYRGGRYGKGPSPRYHGNTRNRGHYLRSGDGGLELNVID